VLLAALVATVACFGALEVSAALAQGRSSNTPWMDTFGNVGPAAAVPTGYWVDVEESGTTTSGNLGGGGSLVATGTGNVNYGFAQECASTANGGPFSSGHYPPETCAELGRPYSSSPPQGFWFTGNEHCASASRPYSGSVFTWHVQLPESGPWHVEAYIPSWTMYGQGNHYIVSSDEGRSESVLSQEASHGQWVTLAGGPHNFTAGQDYTVELTQADTENGFCKYQMADQMKWVYDGVPATAPINTSPPTISGEVEVGKTLTETHGKWTNNPTSYTYQWEDCDASGENCLPIAGATSQAYTPTESDAGQTVVVQETATNAGGSSSPASSSATAVIRVLAPVDSLPPIVSGVAQQGQTLLDVNGVWTNDPSTYNYQWEDCDSSGGSCAPIPGASTQSYTLLAADVGHTIAVKEIAVNAGGSSSPAQSAPTAVVVSSAPATTPIAPVACLSAQTARAGLPTAARASRSAAIARRRTRITAFTPASAVARTVATRARGFNISITLSKGLSRFFDPREECAQLLRGSGYVNFHQRAARWSVELPGVFGGSLKVVAIGNRTYVNAAAFARKGHTVWVKLSSLSDYETFDTVPLLRDIVVLTNPLRSLDVLQSVKAPRHTLARHATYTPEEQAQAADSPSVSASCSKQAQAVVSGDSVDAKHLTDSFALNTKIDSETMDSWGETKISADADSSGVCEEKISVENAEADGFDVVFDFTSSSPSDTTINAPQSTVTEEWKVIYHVKEAPCLDGTWDGDEPQSTPNPTGGEITGTLTGHLAIVASSLSWSYTFNSKDEYPVIVGADPEPPYTPIYAPDSFTGDEGFKGSGPVIGAIAAAGGSFSALPSGDWWRAFSPDLRGVSPGLYAGGDATLSLDIAVNCGARQLTVDAYLPGGEKLIWGFDMHKTSDAPPRITVGQNWRSEISAPVQSGSS